MQTKTNHEAPRLHITPRNLIALQAFSRYLQRTGLTPDAPKLAKEIGRSIPTARQHLDHLTGQGYLNKNDEERYRPWTISDLGYVVLKEALKGDLQQPKAA